MQNHSRLRNHRLAARVVVVVALLALSGCTQTPPEDFLAQANRLIAQREWEKAIPLVKQHLLDNADDPAGHFYLGRCYLNARRPYLAVAEGEFQTALMLFHKNGKVSPIAAFPDTYFEFRCHIEIAKVYLRLYLSAKDQGAPPAALRAILERLRVATETAKRLGADNEDVRQLEKILDTLRPPAPPPVQEPQERFSV
jgi:tetratricopeptide (TPR) repeat protein